MPDSVPVPTPGSAATGSTWTETRCAAPGCILRAATSEGKFCTYHQGWFDAMDHMAKLAEALYDRT